MTRVTFTAGDRSVELYSIADNDWPVCVIGLELLADAIKKARKALTAIGVAPDVVRQREAECSALLDGFKNESPAVKLGVRVDWLPTLRTGLALEYDQTRRLATEQESLRLDSEDTETRIKQLDRLMSDLDVQSFRGAHE